MFGSGFKQKLRSIGTFQSQWGRTVVKETRATEKKLKRMINSEQHFTSALSCCFIEQNENHQPVWKNNLGLCLSE